MRGYNPDPNERPRPIFSRSDDGKLHAGGLPVAPAPQFQDEPEQTPTKRAPVLIIPPKPQPIPKPVPHHLAINPGVAGPQPSVVREPVPRQHVEVYTPAPIPSQPSIFKSQRHAEPETPLHTNHAPKADTTVATDDVDVGDLWSEQERIRLQEAWEDEQRKTARKRRRKELLRKKVTGIPSATEQAKADEVAASSQAVHTDPKEITLNISMPSVPKITLPKIRIPALPRVSKKRALMFGGIAAMLVAGGVGYNVYRDHQDSKAAATAGTTNGVTIRHLDAAKQTGKPDYDTVLPSGKTIKDFGGWVRVSPEDKNPVYAYADQIDTILINVSEQPVPDTFKKDINTSMDDLAASYSANDKIQVGSITAYIGTSLKGPQSVLLVKGDLLILMKSASKIADNHWSTYIRSLQ